MRGARARVGQGPGRHLSEHFEFVAVELKNDVRAWFYLSLSHDALGEQAAATRAANYAASLVILHAQAAAEATDALRSVQGVLRKRLTQLQAEAVSGGRQAALYAPRPSLLSSPAPNAETGVAARR